MVENANYIEQLNVLNGRIKTLYYRIRQHRYKLEAEEFLLNSMKTKLIEDKRKLENGSIKDLQPYCSTLMSNYNLQLDYIEKSLNNRLKYKVIGLCYQGPFNWIDKIQGTKYTQLIFDINNLYLDDAIKVGCIFSNIRECTDISYKKHNSLIDVINELNSPSQLVFEQKLKCDANVLNVISYITAYEMALRFDGKAIQDKLTESIRLLKENNLTDYIEVLLEIDKTMPQYRWVTLFHFIHCKLGAEIVSKIDNGLEFNPKESFRLVIERHKNDTVSSTAIKKLLLFSTNKDRQIELIYRILCNLLVLGLNSTKEVNLFEGPINDDLGDIDNHSYAKEKYNINNKRITEKELIRLDILALLNEPIETALTISRSGILYEYWRRNLAVIRNNGKTIYDIEKHVKNTICKDY